MVDLYISKHFPGFNVINKESKKKRKENKRYIANSVLFVWPWVINQLYMIGVAKPS